MPTLNRTASPLRRTSSEQGQAFKQQTRQTVRALIGDGAGNVYVSSNGGTDGYNKVWIRIEQGVGDNGETLTTAPKRALASQNFYAAENNPVKVYEDSVTGLYVVQENDMLQAAQRGLNLNGLNPQNPSNNEVKLEHIINARPFSPSTNATLSTKISIQPYLYAYNGVLYDAQKGQGDDIDLASSIPSAGLERLAGVGLKVSNNTVQIVNGSTRNITNGTWSLADLNEIYALFDSDVSPLCAYKLANDQSTVSDSDRVFDLRQFINIPNQASDSTLSALIDADGDFVADADNNIVHGYS